jgi:hypothetical protein
MAGGAVICAAVEGIVDEAVVRKLIDRAGGADLLTRPGSSSLPRGIGGRTWLPAGLTA